MESQNTLVSLRPPKPKSPVAIGLRKKGGPFSFCCTVKEAPRSGSLPWVGSLSARHGPKSAAQLTDQTLHNLCLSHWLASDTGEIFCAVSARVADLPKARAGEGSHPTHFGDPVQPRSCFC